MARASLIGPSDEKRLGIIGAVLSISDSAAPSRALYGMPVLGGEAWVAMFLRWCLNITFGFVRMKGRGLIIERDAVLSSFGGRHARKLVHFYTCLRTELRTNRST